MLPPTSEQAMSPNPGTSPAHCGRSPDSDDQRSTATPRWVSVTEELWRRDAKPSG